MASCSRQICTLCVCWLVLAGCSRSQYRMRADGQTYSVLRQKTAGSAWMPPPNYQVLPDPRARFYDPTPIDDPLLPIPAPSLYAYQLPEFPQRDPARFRGGEPSARGEEIIARQGANQAPPPATQRSNTYQLVAYQQPIGPIQDDVLAEFPLLLEAEDEQRVAPIAREVWNSLPQSCLARMLEFASIRQEYRDSFGHEPDPSLRDRAPKLMLEDIVDLAVINSRQYQSEKESLYEVALQLTLNRYDYDLKFSTFGNGTDLNYQHNRFSGATENTLGAPTRINSDKVLATGGDLLARFANDVVLTFNGPNGFAADVGSELLFDISQSVFQRDIVFESLTQSERNVVYAARDFARFRKTLFQDLANQYYSLILAYRGIEIQAQNYFSNLRAFNQGQAEFEVGKRSRIEVDQIEQQVLASRSNLIGRCNSLEQSFDTYKIQIGLPTELPINLDLTELQQISSRDEVTVAAELVKRSRQGLLRARSEAEPEAIILLNNSLDLTRKMLEFDRLSRRLERTILDTAELQREMARFQMDESALIVRIKRSELTAEKSSVPPAPALKIFERTDDLNTSLIKLIQNEIILALELGVQPAAIRPGYREWVALLDQHSMLLRERDEAFQRQEFPRIPEFVATAEQLLNALDQLERRTSALAGRAEPPVEAEPQRFLRQVDQLLQQSLRVLDSQLLGLAPLEIEMDDAMLTALVQRFQMMNQYGELADSWRQIKLAGDDLKTILNLNAAQRIGTRRNLNRPFDFTFDESQTQLSMSVDTPLNRLAQRNTFRRSLINYQAALRNLIALQDQIKLEVRNDLRNLQLDREQYRIAVPSAALAYERVTSTRLELKLARPAVTARDFLEAQRAYTVSINDVASQHIGFLQDRIQLFMDLEALQVDDAGFWPQLYNEQYEPTPQLSRPPNSGPVYGTLPPGVLYSHQLKRMNDVPQGTPLIYQTPSQQVAPPPAGPSEALPPPVAQSAESAPR